MAAVVGSRERAAIQERPFRDVTPIHRRRAELLVTRVNFPREIVTRPDLRDHIVAEAQEFLQEGVVKFQNLDRALVPELAQRNPVVRCELPERAAVLARSDNVYEPLIARIQAVPDTLVDADRKAGAWLVKPGVIVVADNF